jgi:hypothetical protein
MARLAHQTDRLHPTEYLFPSLPTALTFDIAGMSSRSAIDRARTAIHVLGDVGRRPETA